jgi:hypothetical protein
MIWLCNTLSNVVRCDLFWCNEFRKWTELEMKMMELYQGSGEVVEYPDIRISRFTKDFSWGFYCTVKKEKAERWTEKWVGTNKIPTVNFYHYTENPKLRILKFDGLNGEWLDFVAECRGGADHDYDIVEGPMADDVIWDFVGDYLKGKIERETFMSYAKFNRYTHQMSFHTARALRCLKFIGSEVIEHGK